MFKILRGAERKANCAVLGSVTKAKAVLQVLVCGEPGAGLWSKIAGLRHTADSL